MAARRTTTKKGTGSAARRTRGEPKRRSEDHSDQDESDVEVVGLLGGERAEGEPAGLEDDPGDLLGLDSLLLLDEEEGEDTPRLPERSAVLGGGDATAIARLDPMQLYMREVQRHPLLTREQEQDLARRFDETGDVDAAAQLVTANLRLVVKLAYEYRRAYRNIMDLVQEGNIGLMAAVQRFDPHRGVKLSSYAAWWIRAYMLRFILNNHRLVKIGTTQAQRKLFFNLSKERQRLSEMGIEPSHDDIATSLGVDAKDVIEMDKRLARADASLDAPVGDADGKATARGELMPSMSAGPDVIAERAELSEAVRGYLEEFRKTLEGKDAIIFDTRLVTEEPKTLQELGEEFGVSRERVRQIEVRLTGKLRAYLRENLGDAVDVVR